MRPIHMRPLSFAGVLALLALLSLPFLAQATTPTPTTSACSGAYYTVRPGDTWSVVSQRTGISVTELKRLNPTAVRPNNWLWIGDQLCLSSQDAAQGYWYQVKPGDTWNSVSRATDVPVRDLWAANQGLINRLYWLYIGQRIWIPAASPAGTATPTPTASPAPPPPVVTPGSGACATRLDGYPGLILAHLNRPGNTLASLEAWLTGCGALTGDPDAITTAALQSETSADLIITLHDPAASLPSGSGMLLIYHNTPTGYKLAHKAAGAGRVALLTVADLNQDKKVDVVWADTSCGAHTCFTTLFVDSWDGSAYVDWIVGEPTLASAEYRFDDVTPEGAGLEIIARGGVIGSVGAGPQRAWTETYISVKGAPYKLFKQVYDPSPCLYHKILDANDALTKWATDGFDGAIALYTEATTDATLTACGDIPNELTMLRDFARFRLTIALVGAGQRAQAERAAMQLTSPALIRATTTFFSVHRSSGSIVQACRDTNAYAQTDPATWQFLANWGYANPSFSADELCPLK